MPSRERSGEAVSGPIEHSPGPWREDQYNYDLDHWQKGVAWCIRDAQGQIVIEGNPHSGEPRDDNGKLIAAAPIMYRILRVIIEGRPGLIEACAMSEAHRLIRELEGGPDAEA
jgi:hypothetical protein